MRYPENLMNVWDELELFVPDQELVQPVYKKMQAQNPATPFPFWAKIWPSAYALVSFLKEEPQWTAGKNILELGAGIGLPSLALAPQAKSVIISDHAPEAVRLME